MKQWAKAMPYIFMFFATFVLCIAYESLQNVIPGHPIISFLVLAFGAMVLTFLISLLSLIGSAFSAFCCMFLLGCLFVVIIQSIKPDSMQYFILLAVIFSAISLPLCFINLTSGFGATGIPGLSCIIAGILNAHTAAFYILTIEEAWSECPFPKGEFVIQDKILNNTYLVAFYGRLGFRSVLGAVMFYIIFAAGFLGAFVATIILRDRIRALEKENLRGIAYGNADE